MSFPLAFSFIVWKREPINQIQRKKISKWWQKFGSCHLTLFFVRTFLWRLFRRLVISVAYRLPKWPSRLFLCMCLSWQCSSIYFNYAKIEVWQLSKLVITYLSVRDRHKYYHCNILFSGLSKQLRATTNQLCQSWGRVAGISMLSNKRVTECVTVR